MARLVRLEMPLLPHLVMQPVCDGERLVRDSADEQALVQALLSASRTARVSVHAYGATGQGLCLLATPGATGELSAFMQSVGRRYVASYNRRHGRIGGLWAGRFRCAVIDPACYLLDAMALVESPAWDLLNASPHEAVRCSSLSHHLGRRTDPIVRDHELFWDLGNTPFEREAAWRRRLENGVASAVADPLWGAVKGGWALGNEGFLARLAQSGVRRVAPLARGRPRKAPEISLD